MPPHENDHLHNALQDAQDFHRNRMNAAARTNHAGDPETTAFLLFRNAKSHRAFTLESTRTPPTSETIR